MRAGGGRSSTMKLSWVFVLGLIACARSQFQPFTPNIIFPDQGLAQARQLRRSPGLLSDEVREVLQKSLGGSFRFVGGFPIQSVAAKSIYRSSNNELDGPNALFKLANVVRNPQEQSIQQAFNLRPVQVQPFQDSFQRNPFVRPNFQSGFQPVANVLGSAIQPINSVPNDVADSSLAANSIDVNFQPWQQHQNVHLNSRTFQNHRFPNQQFAGANQFQFNRFENTIAKLNNFLENPGPLIEKTIAQQTPVVVVGSADVDDPSVGVNSETPNSEIKSTTTPSTPDISVKTEGEDTLLASSGENSSSGKDLQGELFNPETFESLPENVQETRDIASTPDFQALLEQAKESVLRQGGNPDSISIVRVNPDDIPGLFNNQPDANLFDFSQAQASLPQLPGIPGLPGNVKVIRVNQDDLPSGLLQKEISGNLPENFDIQSILAQSQQDSGALSGLPPNVKVVKLDKDKVNPEILAQLRTGSLSIDKIASLGALEEASTEEPGVTSKSQVEGDTTTEENTRVEQLIDSFLNSNLQRAVFDLDSEGSPAQEVLSDDTATEDPDLVTDSPDVDSYDNE